MNGFAHKFLVVSNLLIVVLVFGSNITTYFYMYLKTYSLIARRVRINHRLMIAMSQIENRNSPNGHDGATATESTSETRENSNNNPRNNTPTNKRILNSILTRIGVYLISGAIAVNLVFIANCLKVSDRNHFNITIYSGVFANVHIACNFFIYYARSVEYREAFKNILFCR